MIWIAVVAVVAGFAIWWVIAAVGSGSGDSGTDGRLRDEPARSSR